jgi:hypothetical protein
MSYEDSMFVFDIPSEKGENETDSIELYPGSSDRKLTRENSEEFISLTAHFVLSMAKD